MGPGPETALCQKEMAETNCASKFMIEPIVWDEGNNVTVKDQYSVFDEVDIYWYEPGVVSSSWMCTKANGCTDGERGVRGFAMVFSPWCAGFGSEEALARDIGGPIRKGLFIHGGSWDSCSPRTCSYAPYVARLATSMCMPIVSIDYTLIPVGSAPKILDQAKKALRWMATHETTSGNTYAKPTVRLLVIQRLDFFPIQPLTSFGMIAVL